MPKLKDVLKDSGKHWLEEKFDTYDLKQNETSPNNTDGQKLDYFRPSSAHLCPRALWYQRNGYERGPIKAQSMRRMNVGTLYHDFIDKKLRGTGVLVSAEEEVSIDNPPVLGHYDAIIKNPDTGEDELVELKSYAEPKRSSKIRLNLPMAAHVMQWNLYSLMTGIANGMLFYINKNDQSYKIYKQIRNDKILTTLFKKFKWVDKAVKDGTRIPYQPDENHAWCDFRTTCERDWFIRGE